MFKFTYRVQEFATVVTTPGQGLLMTGASSGTAGHQAFRDALADGDECVVVAEEVDAAGRPIGAWEVFACNLDTFKIQGTLANRVLISSSTGSFIDWSSGGVDALPRCTLIDRAQGMGREIARWDHAVDGDTTLMDFEYDFAAGRAYVLAMHGVRHDGSGSESMLMRMKRAGSWDTGASDYAAEATQRRGTTLTTRSEQREWIRLTSQTIYGSGGGGNFNNQVRVNGFTWLTALGDTEYSHAVRHGNSPVVATGQIGNDSVVGVHRYNAVAEGVRLFWTTSDFDGGVVQLLEF